MDIAMTPENIYFNYELLKLRNKKKRQGKWHL